jgi:predicted dehydrogenase
MTVAAPDDVHPSLVLAALAAGVPVFCEKPIANTAGVAELVVAQERAGVAATVGYSFRYSPALQQLRADLAGGVPGVRVRVHGSAGAAEAELAESLPGGERYQRLGLDGGPAEQVSLGEEAGGRSGYARRHLRDFLGQPGSQSPGTMPTLAQAASVQHVLDTAAKATERWLPVPGDTQTGP